MNSEFDEFSIHGKLIKMGIQRKKNQVIWNYNQRDILFSKSAILKIGKNEEHYELIFKIKDDIVIVGLINRLILEVGNFLRLTHKP